MVGKLLRGRVSRAMVVAALVGALFAVSSGTPTSAAVSKTVVGTCTGADAASTALIGALGGSSLQVPFTITSDVPATLEPEQSGSPIGFTWTVALDQGLIDKAVGLGLSTLTVKNAKLNVKVSGPTSTTGVESSPIPDIALSLAAGQPASLTQGPFTSTLKDVGKGGIIKYSAGDISLTIVAALAGTVNNVNVTCSAPGTVATTSIKIPGSPDVVQPIELAGQPNVPTNVDVLGKYVTDGTDEKGVERPVQPETLKVLEGPGTIVNGQVQVAAAAAGTTSSVTFEVCSGTLPGVNEVQRLVIDPSPDALKKGIAFTLGFKETTSNPITLLGIPFVFTTPAPDQWIYEANNYIFTVHEVPSPEKIDAALEAMPAIGVGGVSVKAVAGKPGQYDIEFTGVNGEKDVPALSAPSYYSVFPQEILAQIVALAGQLSAPPAGPTTTTTLPPGVTNNREYFDYLVNEGRVALEALNFDLAGQKLAEAFALIPKIILEGLDVQALIGQITALFTTKPALETTVAGEEPIGICSQGVIDVTVAGVAGTNTSSNVAGTSATKSGAGLAFTG